MMRFPSKGKRGLLHYTLRYHKTNAGFLPNVGVMMVFDKIIRQPNVGARSIAPLRNYT